MGNNYIELEGVLRYPSYIDIKEGFYKFQAKLDVPMVYDFDDGSTVLNNTLVKVSCFGDLADSLSLVSEGSVIKVTGVLQERSYMGNCRSCGITDRKYWTDVLVDNFVVTKNV
jgi:hypothetical protein